MTFAIDRTLQCVAFGGASLEVFASTLRFTAADNRARPGLRVLSRVRPSTPSAAKRSCHRHTHGFDLPVARMIAIVPRPSALARMIFARHTTFAGVLRSDTSSRRRVRSAALTSKETFSLIPEH
jgi:hypothetical protein